MSFTFIACIIAFVMLSPFSAKANTIDNIPETPVILERPFAGEGTPMTREAFCAFAAAEFLQGAEPGEPAALADIWDVNPEYVAGIDILHEAGVLGEFLYPEANGYHLKPKELITKQDALLMLSRIIGKSSGEGLAYEDAYSIWPEAYKAVAWFAFHGMIDNYGMFEPFEPITFELFTDIASKTRAFLRINQLFVYNAAGMGSRGATNGTQLRARFNLPYGVILDAGGRLVMFDTYNNLVRRLNNGMVSTLAGRAEGTDEHRFPEGFHRDGEHGEAMFNRVSGGAARPNGDIIIADSANHAIRVIGDGGVYTLAGGEPGYRDGSADSALFNHPADAATDREGNIYIADSLNGVIRMISPNAEISTLAGVAGQFGYRDGAAGQALFREPMGIAVTPEGVVYVSDTGNHVVRRIEDGVVSTFAGSIEQLDEDGEPLGAFRDGSSEFALFNLPVGITVTDGAVVVADSANNRIRAIYQGLVTTIAGDGEPGDISGFALEARLNQPMGVFWYKGTLFIADTHNNKIKAMEFKSSILAD